MSEDNNDTGDSAVDDPVVEMRQSDLSKLMAKTRREGAASAARKADQTSPAPAAQTIAEIVAATVKAMQPATEAPRPAAAPSAPNPHVLPTSMGVTDVFQPGVAATLGPRALRSELEKIWSIAAERSGAPQRPIPGKK